MAQTDLLKRYLDAGVAFTQVTQAKAEEIVGELVRAGEVQTDDARKRVEGLVERSRQHTDGILDLVRSEVQRQVAKLGLVPASEVEDLRRELAELKAQQPATTVAKKAAPSGKAPAKKAVPAGKAPATKAPSKKAPATKATRAKKATPGDPAAPAAASGPTP